MVWLADEGAGCIRALRLDSLTRLRVGCLEFLDGALVLPTTWLIFGTVVILLEGSGSLPLRPLDLWRCVGWL